MSETAHKKPAETAAASRSTVTEGAAEGAEAKTSEGILSKLWSALTWPARKIVNWTRTKLKKAIGKLLPWGEAGIHETAEIKIEAKKSIPDTDAKAAVEVKAKVEKDESPEVVKSIEVTVEGECENEQGLYLQLSQPQAVKLGLKHGAAKEKSEVVAVEIPDGHGGIKTQLYVATDAKESWPDQCRINGVEKGAKIKIKKVDHPENIVAELEVEENVGKHEKAAARKEKIKERFHSDLDAERYIVVPTAYAFLLGCENSKSNKNKAMISKKKVKVGEGEPQEMVIVPSGEKFGMTKGAATALHLNEIQKVKLKVENGILVIEKAESEAKAA